MEALRAHFQGKLNEASRAAFDHLQAEAEKGCNLGDASSVRCSVDAIQTSDALNANLQLWNNLFNSSETTAEYQREGIWLATVKVDSALEEWLVPESGDSPEKKA